MTQPQRVRPLSSSSAHAAEGELGLSDAALMERAAQGDVAAFAQIYDRHAATVLALLRHMSKRTSGEEDLLQEVFLEAWLTARDYDAERASVRAWLLVRARSRAVDRQRRRARESSVHRELADDASGAALANTPQTEHQLAVLEGLSTLVPNVRATLELTFFEGMTAAEVAAAMNVPEGTVKSRLARGLLLMERALFFARAPEGALGPQLEEGSRDE